MRKVATFRITGSFNITGRGLVAIGDIIDGLVKVGNTVVINTGSKDVTVKISGIEMGDRISTGKFFVGLAFTYKDEEEMRASQGLKLPEQIVAILDDAND